MRTMLLVGLLVVGCETELAPPTGGDPGDPCAAEDAGMVFCGERQGSLFRCVNLLEQNNCGRCGQQCPLGTRCGLVSRSIGAGCDFRRSSHPDGGCITGPWHPTERPDSGMEWTQACLE